jgi:NADH-quinone oxidoreductase subunit M
VFATLGVILSAVYMLWMYQRVYYGEVTNPKNEALPDLSPREWAVITPVLAMAIFMGVAPNVFLHPTAASVNKVVERMQARPQSVERVERPAEPARAALEAAR